MHSWRYISDSVLFWNWAILTSASGCCLLCCLSLLALSKKKMNKRWGKEVKSSLDAKLCQVLFLLPTAFEKSIVFLFSNFFLSRFKNIQKFVFSTYTETEFYVALIMMLPFLECCNRRGWCKKLNPQVTTGSNIKGSKWRRIRVGPVPTSVITLSPFYSTTWLGAKFFTCNWNYVFYLSMSGDLVVCVLWYVIFVLL